MRICFVNALDYTQGSTYRARHLAFGLAKLGHSVTYMESTPSFRTGSDSIGGVRWTWIPQSGHTYGLVLGTFLRTFHTLLKKHDILLIQKCLPLTVPCLVNRLLKRSICLLDWDDYDTGYQSKGFRRGAVQFCESYFPCFFDAVTTHSTFLLEMAKRMGVAQNRIRIVHQGVDTTLFHPSKVNPLEERKKLGLDQSDKVLLFMGTFSLGGATDFDCILDVVAKVSASVPVKFLAIGGGPLLERCKRLARERGVENATIFTGAQPHDRVPALISAGDICLLYMRETLANRVRSSLKLLEYWSMAKPVVCHPVGETALMTSPERAILAPQGTGGMADSILFALDHPQMCEEIGQRAREFVECHRDWRQIVQDLESFLYETYETKHSCRGG